MIDQTEPSDEEKRGTLCRVLPSASIGRVVLIGNGAIENGNEPIERFLRHVEGSTYSNVNPSVALSVMAADLQTTRTVHIQALKRGHGCYYARDSAHGSGMELARLRSDRKRLSDEFDRAQQRGEIALRGNIHLWDELDLSNPNTGVITINWDELLWHSDKISNLIQLHGRASIFETLVLPMELINDVTESWFLEQKSTQSMTQDERDSVVRPKAASAALKVAERQAFDWVEKAKDLVIYGIAMNPYDAELFQVLREWGEHHRNDGCLTIINPDHKHAETAARFLKAQEFTRITPYRSEKIRF